jgi:hypothetical protein
VSESYERCTKQINEPCAQHPVDCKNCLDEPSCRYTLLYKSRPDIFKRCRWIRKRPAEAAEKKGPL